MAERFAKCSKMKWTIHHQLAKNKPPTEAFFKKFEIFYCSDFQTMCEFNKSKEYLMARDPDMVLIFKKFYEYMDASRNVQFAKYIIKKEHGKTR